MASSINGQVFIKGRIISAAPVSLPEFTLANLPTAADYEGAIIFVTDADNSNPGVMFSDGMAWSLIGGSANVPVFPGVAATNIYQQFSLVIRNSGGTLQHRFGSLNEVNQVTASSGNFSAINNPAVTNFANTATGPDASTSMADGGKISNPGGGNGFKFYLDTAPQWPAVDGVGVQAVVAENTTGTALMIFPVLDGNNINGNTNIRMSLQFRNPATGAVFDLNTTNIQTNEYIRVNCTGFMIPQP